MMASGRAAYSLHVHPREPRPRDMAATPGPSSPCPTSLAAGGAGSPCAEKRIAELEAKLALSERRFSAAAGGLLDAFYFLEAERDAAGTVVDFRFVEINGPGLKLIGMTREQSIGQRLCELLPINVERGYFEKYKEVVETGKAIRLEESFGAVTGINASWLQFQAVKVGDGVAIHTKDITERKRREQEAERLYLEQRMIFNAVPSLIFYKDAFNNVLRVNEAVARAMGLPISEIEGRSTEELFPEEAAAYYRDDLEVIRRGEARLGYVEPQTLPNGRRTWIRTDKSPLYGSDGELLGILAVVTDITVQREATFQAAVLEKAVEERQAMGRNLHDGIGQQFTGVRMLIEKVRKQVKRGELPEVDALDEIAGVVAAASTEVRRMISGLSPERITPEELPVALDQVASNLENFYNVAARCECDREVVELDVETANHFLGIAQEAAINAAKHAEASLVKIRLTVDEASVTLSVLDDGRGIPRSSGVGAVTESTGRGMQILHHRASAMGARLEIGPGEIECRDDADGPDPDSAQGPDADFSRSGGSSPGRGPGTHVCCTLPR